jgi:hypothetical protein
MYSVDKELMCIQGLDTMPVPNWPGYRVSTSGVVFSCRTCAGKLSNNWKKRKLSDNSSGCLCVTLWNCRKHYHITVNRLVLEAFVRLPLEGEWALHKNGNILDNRLSNLYWGTPVASGSARKEHGTTAKGESNGRCKLSDLDVSHIKRMREETGLSYQRIADAFNMSQAQVIRICKGQSR